MKKLAFLTAVILFIGCTASKQIMTSQADVDRVSSKFSGYTLADLNRGKGLYEQHCGICHGLKKPTSYSEEKWQKIVPPMCEKVNKKEGNVLDAKAQEDILRYVITMSSAK